MKKEPRKAAGGAYVRLASLVPRELSQLVQDGLNGSAVYRSSAWAEAMREAQTDRLRMLLEILGS